MDNNYLLIIDFAPLKPSFKDYFASININILQQNELNIKPDALETLYAILIDWTILKKNLKSMTYIFQNVCPILLIHDRPDREACISALEAGADDFLVKPLNPKMLQARIQAIRRRIAARVQDKKEQCILKFSKWRLLPASRQVFDENNHELFLSAGEYDLLLIFLQNPQEILSREFLLQRTKQRGLNPLDRRIDIQISRLRQKIEPDPKKPQLLKTVRHKGYIWGSLRNHGP